MKKEKIRVDLDDRVWGITGTVDPEDYKIPATGFDSDRDLVYIKYKPARKTKRALNIFLSRFMGKDHSRRTPMPVPEKETDIVPCPSTTAKDDDQDLAGQPNRKLVIREDKDGNAPYEETIRDREESKIRQLEKEKSRSESETFRTAAEANSFRSDDEDKKKRRRPRFRDDPMEGMH